MQKQSENNRLYRTPFSRAYWAQAASEMRNLRMLLFAAMIIALRVALKAVKIPIAADVNINIGFIVNAFGSMVYGPVVALLGAAVSDTLGCLLVPSGPYYFPFIFLEMAGSLIFALFLYRAEVSIPRLILSRFCICFIVNILMTEPIMIRYYQLFLTSQYQPFQLVRIAKNLVLFPVESVILAVLFRSLIPPFRQLGFLYTGVEKLRLTKRHVVLLTVLFVIGASATAGYLVYDYNNKSFSASYTAQERLERNLEMNAWVAEESDIPAQELVTVIESARSTVGSPQMTYELAVYRIDEARFLEKQAEADAAVAAGEEGAKPYTLDTLNGYSKSKAAKDDALLRVGSGTAVTDKKTGERISLTLTWE